MINEIPEDSVFNSIEVNQEDFYAFLERNSNIQKQSKKKTLLEW